MLGEKKPIIHPRPTNSRPAWALDWGEDVYGTFACIEIAGIQQVLRWIGPGEFCLGSPEKENGRWKDEGPRNRKIVKQGFWMFQTAVAQHLWQAVMGYNPSVHRDPDFPVDSVNWYEASIFADRLTNQIPSLSFFLPLEYEWEYACRAGTQSAYCFGEEIDQSKAQFLVDLPAPVQSFPPNSWGLLQMHGNVWEWCADIWRDNYDVETIAPETLSDYRSGLPERVVRGGSFLLRATALRSSFRSKSLTRYRGSDLGFRCVARESVSAN